MLAALYFCAYTVVKTVVLVIGSRARAALQNTLTHHGMIVFGQPTVIKSVICVRHACAHPVNRKGSGLSQWLKKFTLSITLVGVNRVGAYGKFNTLLCVTSGLRPVAN